MLSRLDHSHELAADFEEVIISDSLQKSMSFHQVASVKRRHSNIKKNFKYLTHSLLFDSPLCCSFSFLPFSLMLSLFFPTV